MNLVTLRMTDGVRVVVPDSLHLITPYVLLEQQDWFEDEIKFLRRLLQPGQRAIDIGANHGVYTLSIANTVGPDGRVWAFEPACDTAARLAASIAANRCEHVTLEQAAVSNRCGTADLSINTNSELNALAPSGGSGGAVENVPLTTLDDALVRHGWHDIDFLKLDAEGEEGRILDGGARFFAELSPLIQYEVKAGTRLQLELVAQFAALGYTSYRLVPGLDLLVPFDPAVAPDAYLLNLFCCKPDRAARLARAGHLLEAGTSAEDPEDAASHDWRRIAAHPRFGWRDTLPRLPYGQQMASVWEASLAASAQSDLVQALAWHAFSLDRSQPIAWRYRALQASGLALTACVQAQPQHLHLASLARVATELGARSVAVTALNRLVGLLQQGSSVDASLPFLAPIRRFDGLAPGASIGNWLLAAASEGLELLGSFSSFYTGASAHARLRLIHAMGHSSDEMTRRLMLVERRFGLQTPG